MDSQDKWYVNKDGVDIMDVIVSDSLKYHEGRALKCIIKGDLENAAVYITMMETVREGRLESVDRLCAGFDLNDTQRALIEHWKELI